MNQAVINNLALAMQQKALGVLAVLLGPVEELA